MELDSLAIQLNWDSWLKPEGRNYLEMNRKPKDTESEFSTNRRDLYVSQDQVVEE